MSTVNAQLCVKTLVMIAFYADKLRQPPKTLSRVKLRGIQQDLRSLTSDLRSSTSSLRSTTLFGRFCYIGIVDFCSFLMFCHCFLYLGCSVLVQTTEIQGGAKNGATISLQIF